MRLLTATTPLWLALTAMVTGLPYTIQDTFNTSILSYHPATPHNRLDISILVLPGGGYSYVSLNREGTNSTLYLNAKGYDTWVLNYMTASTPNAPVPLYPVPNEQALGFLAGGHLAAITVTDEEVQGEINFRVLTYLVISMDESITHQGSRVNLIGENPSPKLMQEQSAETRVINSTPLMFMYNSADDATIPVENTLRFISALVENEVLFQILILPDADHRIALGLMDLQQN